MHKNEKRQESKDNEKDDSVVKHPLWSYLARDDYLADSHQNDVSTYKNTRKKISLINFL